MGSSSILDIIANAAPGVQAAEAYAKQAPANLAATQAQTQGQQLQNQIAQQQLKDQRAITAAIKAAYGGTPQPQSPSGAPAVSAPTGAALASTVNPAPAFNRDAFLRTYMQNGGSGLGAQNYLKGMIGLQSDAAKLSSEQLKLRQESIQPVANEVYGIEDPSKMTSAQWQDLSQRILQVDPNAQALGIRPDAIPSTQQWQGLQAQLNLTDRIVGRQAAQKKLALDDADIALKQADAASKKVGAAAEQAKLDALQKWQANPTGQVETVNTIWDPQKYPQQNANMRAELQTATASGDMGKVNEAIAANRSASDEIAKAKDKELQAMEIGKSVAIERQTAPIKEQIAAVAENQRHALEQGDQGRAKYFESQGDLLNAENTAQTMHDFTKAARSGNAVSSAQLQAMVPELVNSLQDIKRMGAAQGGEGLSSKLDFIKNTVDSLGAGTPLNENTLKQIDELADTVSAAARRKHNANVGIINNVYPVKFPYEYKAGDTRVVDGKTYTRDSSGNWTAK